VAGGDRIAPPQGRGKNGGNGSDDEAGGGGFWNPLERDPERMLDDVRAGYVSLEAARQDYGVVIRQRGRHFELDLEATRALRKTRES